jgi:general secretion pathway protein H
MTSAIGDGARRPGGAFTLLELILAIAVIALLATVFIGASSTLLSDKPATPEDVFWKACQTARKEALATGREVRLEFDDKAKAFVIDDGVSPQSMPVPGATQDFSAGFIPGGSRASLALMAGSLVETGSIPFVTFYGDGTCTPFRIQFKLSSGAHTLSVDPWTCAPILPAAPAAS